MDLILYGAGCLMQGQHFIVEVAHPGQLYPLNNVAGQHFFLQAADEGRFNAVVLELLFAAHYNDTQPVYRSGFGVPEKLQLAPEVQFAVHML